MALRPERFNERPNPNYDDLCINLLDKLCELLGYMRPKKYYRIDRNKFRDELDVAEKDIERLEQYSEDAINDELGEDGAEEGDAVPSGDDFGSDVGSEREDAPKFPVFKPTFDPVFEIGMIFSNKYEFRECYRAKNLALKEIEDSVEEQYTKLWDYAEELRRSNPGSTILIQIADGDGAVGKENLKSFMHLRGSLNTAGFRGLAFKIALWNAAKATTVLEWEWRMQEIGKPVLTMLEWVRQYLMTRLQENRGKAKKRWSDKPCPKIKKIVEQNIEKSSDCIPIKSDDLHYEINIYDGSRFTVDLSKHSCSCRKWELTSIPYKHGMSAIVCQGLNPEVSRPSRARRLEPYEPTRKTKKKARGHKQPAKLSRQPYSIICTFCGRTRHNKKGYELRKKLEEGVQAPSPAEESAIGKSNQSKRGKLTARKRTSNTSGKEQLDVMEPIIMVPTPQLTIPTPQLTMPHLPPVFGSVQSSPGSILLSNTQSSRWYSSIFSSSIIEGWTEMCQYV
ncbi:UNVERIFIED_CONTAM: hypothetical protein Scaly_2923200 [Sesamum calycinum]|uniref:SWIM-type domain-containing protein n=1 Tax=Sesamum calycinum TaxID=2727403 RepID=A0AAW2L107_9LAMI